MAYSDLYLSTKIGDLPSPFTNEYLLKHGNIFMRPKIPPNGFPCAFSPAEIGYASPNGLISGLPSVTTNYDAPLDFVIKHEKPPTPPASTSPVGCKTPPTPASEEKVEQVQLPTSDQSKNSTWILGKQKLSWDNSTVASYNPETKMFRCVVCNAVGFLSRIAEHYLGTHTSAKVFQCLHCPYSSTWSRCVRMHMAKHHGVPNAPPSLWKGQPLLEEIFLLLTNLKSTVDSQGRDRLDPELCDKKFVCPKCPYTTDRRDLYLRHENIHKEDKPYHCYICFKLFNRADHVKKHFLRIHRGHPYDISLVRRRPPRNASSASSNAKVVVNGSTAKVDVKNGVDKCHVVQNGGNKSPCEGTAVDMTMKNAGGGGDGGAASSPGVKGFECPFCSWEGADAWCLRRHMSVHTKNFNCPNCNFKASKPENLFTHVYKVHRMLVCTKCKFVTDQAHNFENHIKDCCAEIVLGVNSPKVDSEESDGGVCNVSTKVKIEPNDPYCPSEINLKLEPFLSLDSKSDAFPTDKRNGGCCPKASVSIMPLHNSISYCFPSHSAPSLFTNIPALAGCSDISVRVMDDDLSGPTKNGQTKADTKTDLSSPVQSSSDSGVADIASDQTELDLTCWHCGCEFANESSLNTHTELYHRSQRASKISDQQCKKKFSCALCEFASNEQTAILDHMRYHTGEPLPCRAGHPCTFTNVSDTTLREHVLKEHSDGKPRCPHCALHCTDRVSFIRHYRRFHHSTSCYRCRSLRRSYEASSGKHDPDVVQPYLKHNPYAKSNGGSSTPYTHHDSAMSNIAVSIPLTALNDCALNGDDSNDRCAGERRSRKQSTPRKLVQQDDGDGTPPTAGESSSTAPRKNRRPLKSTLKRSTLEKFLSSGRLQSKHSGWDRIQTASYRNKVNRILSRGIQKTAKFKCQTCGERFSYVYQRIIHNRKKHERSKLLDA